MSILYAILMVYIAGEYCGPGFLLVKKRPKKKKKKKNIKKPRRYRQIDRQIDRWMKK